MVSGLEIDKEEFLSWKVQLHIERFTEPIPINYQKAVAHWLYTIIGLDATLPVNWSNFNSRKPYSIDTNAYHIHFTNPGTLYIKGIGRSNRDRLYRWIAENESASTLGLNINQQATLDSFKEVDLSDLEYVFPDETNVPIRQIWGSTSPVCNVKECVDGFNFLNYTADEFYEVLTWKAKDILEVFGIDTEGFSIQHTTHGDKKVKGIHFKPSSGVDEVLSCCLLSFEIQATPRQMHVIEHVGLGDYCWSGFGCIKRFYFD